MEEDRAKIQYLELLVFEGGQLLSKMESKLCDRDVDLGDYVTWSRNIRKPLESMCYSGFCDITPAAAAAVEELAKTFAEPRWCPAVQETHKDLTGLSRTLTTAKKRISELQKHLEMPLNICHGQAELFDLTAGVLDPHGSRCRDPETGQWIYSEACGFEPAGITTTALGMDGLTRYEFEFKIIELDKLIISHDPFTFEVNPEYPEELQPRIRERAAAKVQVEKIAANLEPEAVITDFHVIDRGTPIVGPDLVVEAGNGRVMGITKAAADHPDKYKEYKDQLRERAGDYGLKAKDIDSMEKPVLIRVRMTDVDRTTFAQEANQAATIAPSAIENARTDAPKITMGMLQSLVVGENESLEDALRAPKNQAFAKKFLGTLPENVQASLVDAQGYLNRDGVHRMAMAIFVSAFRGDSGLRLAEKAFESVDMDVRNTVNAIARSLGPMAQAEALTRTGERDPALSIGDDLAQTVNVYSAIKRNPALTIDKYLAQEQMFTRELTPFQEGILVVLDEYKRAPRKLAGIFTAYAEGVIAAPPPAQGALFPGAEITKEILWDNAVKAPEAQPALMEVSKMFEEKACERPSSEYEYLSMFFTETIPEAVLFETEPGQTERKIDTALAQLQSGIEAIHESDNFKAFIDTLAKFHDYSLGNVMLITMQMPTASRVAGYTTWQGLGRQVNKGEKGIMILAPCFAPKGKKEKKEEEDEEEKIELAPTPVFFKVVHVFDISQTSGDELPGEIEVPVITGDETGPLFRETASYVAKQGIKLSAEPKPDLSESIMGYWSKSENTIWVRPDAPQDQQTKTLLHEAAHALCSMRGSQSAEVMAESVAYTVANHFGFDTGVRSFPYVAVWSGDIKVLKGNLEIIRKVSKEMIEGIEHVADMSEVVKLFAPIKLLTKEIRGKLPSMYSQEDVEDPMVWVKFFTPDSNWTWYGIEFDGDDIFYGFVVGFEQELGYFSLKELSEARGPLGLPIERDKWFKPMLLSEVKELHKGDLYHGEMGAPKFRSRVEELSREISRGLGILMKKYELMKETTSSSTNIFTSEYYPGERYTKITKEVGNDLVPMFTAIRELESLTTGGELSEGITSAIITGAGIGVGSKFIDWLAGTFSKRGLQEEVEIEYPAKKMIVGQTFRLYNKEKMIWADITAPTLDDAIEFLGWGVGDISIWKVWKSSGKIGESGHPTSGGWGKLVPLGGEDKELRTVAEALSQAEEA